MVLCAASLLQVVTMYVAGRIADHHQILGVTGASAVLFAVGAAVLAGPVAGALVSVAGGAAFFVFVTDVGSTAPLPTTLVSSLAWALSAVAAGVVASRLRRAEAQRRAAEEDAARLHARLEARLMPRIDGLARNLEVMARYRPGEQRLAIGGDFFDVMMDAGGATAVVIGDVVGHGADAAALGATLRAGWHALTADGAAPDRLIEALRAVLEHERDDPDVYATLCSAWLHIDRSELEILTLGHVSPLIGSEGTLESVCVRPLPPLGLWQDLEVRTTIVPLPKQWTLFFYTDGIIEGRAAPGAAERYGLARFCRGLEHALTLRPTPAAIDEVLADVEAANGGALSDDATILAVSTIGLQDAGAGQPAEGEGRACRTQARPSRRASRGLVRGLETGARSADR